MMSSKSLSNEEIDNLSFKELQECCRDAKIGTGGKTATLRKRLRAWSMHQVSQEEEIENTNNNNNNNKRQKRSPADELICPITLHLPWEPVTAEDGCIYEKDAIQEHIRTCQAKPGETIRSPVMNVIMGPRLFPAPRHRSLTEILVADGSIQGDLANIWNEKVEEAKLKAEALQDATNGDPDAMYHVAECYHNGEYGFPKDLEEAYRWKHKGHLAGHVKCTARLGQALRRGLGCYKSTSESLVFVTKAASEGSNFAAYELGRAYEKGLYGLCYNRDEAIYWLKKAVEDECQYDHISKSSKQKAKIKLDELVRLQVLETISCL